MTMHFVKVRQKVNSASQKRHNLEDSQTELRISDQFLPQRHLDAVRGTYRVFRINEAM